MGTMSEIVGLPSRYRIESIIGEGGFGKVYRVFDSKLDRVLALKTISQDSSTIRASLMKEFKVLSKLQHPNLVRVYDFGTLESRLFYFTMEYLEGADLRSFLGGAGNLNAVPALIDQLLAALEFLNENGVVHGDIKPENVMIAATGTSLSAKLLDFGLTSSGAGRSRGVSGTPRFLAPEILQSGARKSPSTDLYALGASLCESIENLDFPAAIDLADELLKHRYDGMSKKLSGASVKNPSSIASFILDLCDADPLQRPSSAKAARDSFRTKVLSLDAESAPTIHPVFVDRERELDEIAQFLRQRQKEKKVLVLRGPRGVGKKSIIRKVAQAEQLKQRFIIDLSSIPYNYFSMKELVRIVSDQLPGPEQRILLDKTSTIFSSAQSFKDVVDSGDMEQRSLVLMNYIVDVLHEIASRRPTVLILPDIDRLGPDHVRFVNQILTHLDLADSNIKIVLSLNEDVHPTEEVSRLVARLGASPDAAFLDVEGFSDNVLKDYFLGTFGEELFSDSERGHLLTRTHGLPLVIETALRHLLSQGIIRREDGKWTFNRILFAQSDIPIESKGGLELILGDLKEDERNLLELLAILNHEISSDRLADLAGSTIPSWESAKHALIAKAIILARPNGFISFAHPSYREAIIQNCHADRLKERNLRVAAFLSAAEPNEFIRIARHYIDGNDIDKAMMHGQEIANNLYSYYMPYDCLHFFIHLKNFALRMGIPAHCSQVYAWLAPLQHQAGLLHEAVESYTLLIRNEQHPIIKASYMMKLSYIFESLGDSRAALVSARKARHILRNKQMEHLTAEIYLILGDLSKRRKTYYLEMAQALFKRVDLNMYLIALAKLCHRYKRGGDMKKLRSNLHLLERYLPRANDNARKAIHHCLGSVSFLSGEYEDQLLHLEEKLSIEKRHDDMQGMIQSLNSICGNYYARGNYPLLLANIKNAYSLAIRYNQLSEAVNAGYNIVLAYRALGDYGQAMASINHTERLARERSITQIGSTSNIKPAQLYALLGKSFEKRFISKMHMLRLSAANFNSAIGLGHYNMCYSTYHHINLRHKKALTFADKALAFFKKAEDRDDVVLALVQKSILLATLGEIKEAARSIKQAVKIYDEIHCEYLKPFLMLGRGMIARCAGDDDARALLAEGLRASKKMGTRENTWQIQRELALYHRDRSEYGKAIDYFQDAIETLKQITETLDEEELKISYLEVPSRKRIFDEIKDLKKRTK